MSESFYIDIISEMDLPLLAAQLFPIDLNYFLGVVRHLCLHEHLIKWVRAILLDSAEFLVLILLDFPGLAEVFT